MTSEKICKKCSGNGYVTNVEHGDGMNIKRSIPCSSCVTQLWVPPEIDPNPKEKFGTAKVSLSCVPAPVLMELGVAMSEGALKYGRHNYRVSQINMSTYYDASIRHLMSWWEGEDIDPESGLSHVTKAIASLVVLRDSMMFGKSMDDRPPAHDKNWITDLNEKNQEMRKRICNTDQNPTPSKGSSLDKIV